MAANNIKIIFLSGILIRLAVMPFIAQFGDCFNWYNFTYVFLKQPLEVYRAANYFFPMTGNIYSYPPLWVFTLAVFTLPLFFWGITSAAVILIFVKLPLILSSAVLAYLVWKISRSEIATALFYLNPLLIFTDSIWGAFDILPAAAVFLAYIFLINRKNLASGLCLGIGILYKIWPALIFPMLLIDFLKQKKYREGAGYAAVVILTVIGGCLPFVLPFNRQYFLKEVLVHASRGINWQMSSWTPFFWLGKVVYYNPSGARLFTIIFYAAFLLLYFIPLKKNLDKRQLFILPIILFYLASPWVVPSFYVWILPFLAICVWQKQIALLPYIIISTLPILSELGCAATYRLVWGNYLSFPLMQMKGGGMILSLAAVLLTAIWIYIARKIIILPAARDVFPAITIPIRRKQKICALFLGAVCVAAALTGAKNIKNYNPDNQLINLFWGTYRDERACSELGIYYAINNRPELSAANFNAAIAFAPQAAKNHVNLAAFYSRQNQWEEATRYIRQAEELDPQYAALMEQVRKQKKLDFITSIPHKW